MVPLGFMKVHPEAKMPERAHPTDAGMDVYAVELTRLEPFKPTLVRTGLVPDILDGYEIQVRPRSGLALKHGVTVWNSPGTIDSGYKSEIGIIMLWTPYANETDSEGHHPHGFIINKGDRIAQFVLAPVTPCKVREVFSVGESIRTRTGHNGFGSTGR